MRDSEDHAVRAGDRLERHKRRWALLLCALGIGLGIDEHRIVKTIVLKNGAGRPLIMLMHGDREISTKALARALGEKSVELCERAEAERHSGYHCGGTSPFGFRRPGVPVYVQRSVLDLDWIAINGGQRGLFVRIAPALLTSILGARPLDAEQAAP